MSIRLSARGLAAVVVLMTARAQSLSVLRRLVVAGCLVVATSVVGASPASAALATDWTTVSAGDSHTCAIRSVGKLYCWGRRRHRAGRQRRHHRRRDLPGADHLGHRLENRLGRGQPHVCDPLGRQAVLLGQRRQRAGRQRRHHRQRDLPGADHLGHRLENRLGRGQPHVCGPRSASCTAGATTATGRSATAPPPAT